MSVPIASSPAPALWQPIGEIVADFRTECSDLEQLVQSLFDQLDQLRAELERKAHDIDRERQRVVERERQLSEQRKETSRIAHQFEHQEAKLSEALAELDEVKSLLRRQYDESTQRDALHDSQLNKQLAQLQRERQTLHRQLTDSQSELTKSVGLARDLAQARKEIGDLRSELASRGDGGAEGGSHDGSYDRAALEAELEAVRGRAAELYETLAHERRSLSEQRSEAATEMKQLRRIVERQAELLGERPNNQTVTVARETTVEHFDDEPIEETSSSDPVISSVMAQFAKLQKEVAERRKQRKVK
ncbi:MAG TPA: hypothetical protein VL096_15585 [Pirellulaceae bacterium]|nr:hypothetical protein [Pirellulaceae bacterium]